MARRVLGAFAVTATAALASLALATPASAHTPQSSAECVGDKAVLKVKLTAYKDGNSNTVLIKDGDKVLADEKFGQSWGEKKYEADGTVAHTFTIEVKAVDTKPGQNFDHKKTYQLDACVKKTTPPSSSATKPPATTATSAPEVPSSSVAVPSSSTPAAPAPGGSTPEPPLAATGASPLWLLLSGVGLVGAGAGALLFVRRRRA